MKRRITFLVTLLISVGVANAAVRNEKSITRNQNHQTTVRTATQRGSNNKNIVVRNAVQKTTERKNTSIRNARNATQTNARAGTLSRTAQPNLSTKRKTSRVTQSINTNSARTIVSRAALGAPEPAEKMGDGYNTCRDAYFTCMDQFCGTVNDTYRRCYCSSKLTEIQSRERALSQAANQLQDFRDLNLNVIDKTANEVNAMVSASEGEIAQASAKDKSNSAKQLSGISDVLSKSKKKSLSTQGSLDVAGDINAIWSTTDLAGGDNLANLSGESLYNAVHAQCTEMVSESCPDAATKTMVVSAYGMYIENDCTLLVNKLDKQLVSANATIRDTEYTMGDLRLENYNSHNSSSIHECIAQVRQDITANSACGTDYVHCLDITGRYLNYETGEPIYTAEFFQLDTQTSLSGDLLTNQTNRLLVERLNNMREHAKRGLDTCRDISDNVWNEFLRQAITEIHQGQQDRIRKVKSECLDVVNKCYDEQNKSLKDFSNTDEALLLGSRLELSEQMCREKLDTCSNLYGGGTEGLEALTNAMIDIVDQQIAQQCLSTLQEYTKELCAVSGTDTLHAYPYGCRTYTPGTQKFVSKPECNNSINKSQVFGKKNTRYKPASCIKKYSSCLPGYYLREGVAYQSLKKVATVAKSAITPNIKHSRLHTRATIQQQAAQAPMQNYQPTSAITVRECVKCPEGTFCPGGNQLITDPDKELKPLNCGADYAGSLYHKLASYAYDVCIRPSKRGEALPHTVLQDINVVMDQIRTGMSKELSEECERLGGTWVSTAYEETSTVKTLSEYDKETSANKQWGYCKQ
jgi:hypothetical protein